MGYAYIKQDAAATPTLHVKFEQEGGTVYRGEEYKLGVYATDGNGIVLDVSPTVTLSLREGASADTDDTLKDGAGGSAITTKALTDGVWSDATVAIEGGTAEGLNQAIRATADGYTTGDSATFTVRSRLKEVSSTIADLSAYSNRAENSSYIICSKSQSVMKIDLATMAATTGALTDSNTGSMGAFDGTYIYLTNGNDNKVYRVLLSDLSEVDSSATVGSSMADVEIDSTNYVVAMIQDGIARFDYPGMGNEASETSVSMYSYTSDWMRIIDGDCYRYTHNGANGGKLYKYDISTLAAPSVLDLNSFLSSDIMGAVADDDGRYIYVPGNDNDLMMKIDTQDFTTDGVTVSSDAAFDDVDVVLVRSGYGYCYSNDNNAIVKFDTSDLSIVWQETASLSGRTFTSNIIGHDGTYFYMADVSNNVLCRFYDS